MTLYVVCSWSGSKTRPTPKASSRLLSTRTLTVRLMYTALTASVPSWLKVYELESQPNDKGKVNLRSRRSSRKSCTTTTSSSSTGGAWFLQGNKYAEGVDALEKFLDVKKALSSLKTRMSLLSTPTR